MLWLRDDDRANPDSAITMQAAVIVAPLLAHCRSETPASCTSGLASALSSGRSPISGILPMFPALLGMWRSCTRSDSGTFRKNSPNRRSPQKGFPKWLVPLKGICNLHD